jgi:hypothetical protein
MFKWLTINRLKISLAVLWILDIILTLIFVNIGGIEVEANPVMRLVFEQTGNTGFVLIKLAVLAFFWYYTTLISREWIRLVTLGLNLIMLHVVIMGALTAHFALTFAH